MSVNIDKDILDVIHHLEKRFGELPTENEVYGFIMGDKEERQKIWNSREEVKR